MKTSVEIDDELGGRIKRLAELNQRPADHFRRDAIEQRADRMKARDDFVNEAEASWAADQQDGLRLTGEEVSASYKSSGGPARFVGK